MSLIETTSQLQVMEDCDQPKDEKSNNIRLSKTDSDNGNIFLEVPGKNGQDSFHDYFHEPKLLIEWGSIPARVKPKTIKIGIHRFLFDVQH